MYDVKKLESFGKSKGQMGCSVQFEFFTRDNEKQLISYRVIQIKTLLSVIVVLKEF